MAPCRETRGTNSLGESTTRLESFPDIPNTAAFPLPRSSALYSRVWQLVIQHEPEVEENGNYPWGLAARGLDMSCRVNALIVGLLFRKSEIVDVKESAEQYFGSGRCEAGGFLLHVMQEHGSILPLHPKS
jgi:hypothetical protein